MLEKKGKALKKILRYIPTKDFIGEMINGMMMIYNIRENNKEKYIGDFIGEINIGSRKKVYKYLLGLIMSAEYKETKNANKLFNKNKDKIKKYVEEIVLYYLKEHSYKVLEKKSSAEEIAFNAFLSYFDFDILRFREQTLEYIENFYRPFDDDIKILTGLQLNDYIKLEKFIENSFNPIKKKRRYIQLEKQFSFCESLEEKKAFFKEKENEIKKSINFYIITLEELEEEFGKEKSEKILKYFSMERKEREFLFFTQNNPYLKTPLCKVGEEEYMAGLPEYFSEAIYSFLEEKLLNQEAKKASKFKQRKDLIVEEYFAKTLQELFQDKAKIYTNIFEEKGTREHDVLIEIEDYIFVCEIKASKIKEGNKNINPEETYQKIKDHFNSASGIGKGYIQANKLRKILLDKSYITLYNSKNKKLEFNNTNTKKIIPIILTLGQFGMIGINVSPLLEKEISDPYPWVCNLHDLENIIVINKEKKIGINKILKYIEFRSKEHEKICSGDELDIYESFIELDEFPETDDDKYFFMPSQSGELIDKIYFQKKGLPIIENKEERILFSRYLPSKSIKIKRNDPCPCGSGRKYKKCCYLNNIN